MRYPSFIESDFAFPAFMHAVMHFPRPRIDDLTAALTGATKQLAQAAGIKAGDRVALGVGSRGIAHLPLMVRSIVAELKHLGADVFIVPAMGSHGGATPGGQVGVLARLGVTADSCGAPIRPAMAAIEMGRVWEDVPVYFAQAACQADHTIAINRVKPHTKFKGPLESGIAKMLCVGLGKHEGALAFHRFALRHGFHPLLRAMAEALKARTNFRGAIGIVENAYEEACRIEAVPVQDMFAKEAELLEAAKSHLPRLPFRDLDLLVIRRIGKEISGAGMDPNVTGRAFDLMESDFSDQLKATRVAVLDLSDHSGGNAIGMGNADIITEKVFARMDYGVTLMNALTSLSLHKAFIPVRLPNDRKAIQAGFTTLGPVAPGEVRAVIIEDTRQTTEFLASAALAAELGAVPEAEIRSTASLAFDADDNLRVPWDGD